MKREMVIVRTIRQAAHLSVYTSSISNFYDLNDQDCIFNRIYNSILTLAHPIGITTGQLLASGRSRIVGQGFDTSNNAPAIGLASDRSDFL
jgi:hypothetical protein